MSYDFEYFLKIGYIFINFGDFLFLVSINKGKIKEKDAKLIDKFV